MQFLIGSFPMLEEDSWFIFYTTYIVSRGFPDNTGDGFPVP